MPAALQKADAIITTKLSNKEKNRFDELPSLIEKAEKRIEAHKVDLNALDFASSDAEKRDRLDKIQRDLAIQEKKLEELFEEWAILESKSLS